MKQLTKTTELGAQPAETDPFAANLQFLRQELVATVEEIRGRYEGPSPMDEQGQRLLNAAIKDLEELDRRIRAMS
ncbi:hypothetical protein SAMN04488693_1457 [Arthrobacter subterraneus]|uniref:Uncharacterized protein n=1 Tax=Arthrobacter subterraneus TaxID=335973 RepID=A0A1G8QA05_9MICC|nr:hypothetical protein [Arthrobacter subterraneus]SDJ00920.1 hypothetical protein SAMN04488693_1457 [Arthrobacter subterraneus]